MVRVRNSEWNFNAFSCEGENSHSIKQDLKAASDETRWGFWSMMATKSKGVATNWRIFLQLLFLFKREESRVCNQSKMANSSRIMRWSRSMVEWKTRFCLSLQFNFHSGDHVFITLKVHNKGSVRRLDGWRRKFNFGGKIEDNNVNMCLQIKCFTMTHWGRRTNRLKGCESFYQILSSRLSLLCLRVLEKKNLTLRIKNFSLFYFFKIHFWINKAKNVF